MAPAYTTEAQNIASLIITAVIGWSTYNSAFVVLSSTRKGDEQICQLLRKDGIALTIFNPYLRQSIPASSTKEFCTTMAIAVMFRFSTSQSTIKQGKEKGMQRVPIRYTGLANQNYVSFLTEKQRYPEILASLCQYFHTIDQQRRVVQSSQRSC